MQRGCDMAASQQRHSRVTATSHLDQPPSSCRSLYVCMCVRMFRIENSISEPIGTKLGTHTLRAPAGVIGYFSSSIDIDFIDFLQNLCYGSGIWHRGVIEHADHPHGSACSITLCANSQPRSSNFAKNR